MKIVMKPQGQDEFFFDQLSNLSFSPETDLSGNKLPSNTFECDVHTNYQFEQGMWVELQDDMDNLFARYWLVDSVYKGRGKNGYISVYHIKCESPLGVFDKVKMPAKMYNTTAQGVLTEILQAVNSYGVIGDIIEDTVIADDFTGTNVTGFCPEQTARERLQWLLLLTNSYIKNFFDASIRIKRMTTGSGTMIPIEKTYWKPELTNRAYVTKIVVHGYTFTQGTPQNTDQYVTDGTTTWIVTDQRVQITNTNVPNDVPENIVEVEGVMILTPTQASIVASNLAVIYFNRVEVDAEVIDNAEYIPGDKVTICVDNSENGRRWQTGFIERVDFSFGTQAKGRLHIAPSEEVTVCELTVVYMWDTIQLAVRSYFFPYSYPYRLETDFLDQKITGHRYVFRPNTAIISGTITGDETVTVQCSIALDGFTQGKSDRTEISAEFSKLKTWISEHYAPMLSSQSLTDDYKALLLRDLNIIISQINEASVLALEGVSDHEQALHVVSVDGLETSEDQGVKVLYINGDHRIDGWDEGEEDVPDQPAPEPTPEPEPEPTYGKGKYEWVPGAVDYDPWAPGISAQQYDQDPTIVHADFPDIGYVGAYAFNNCPNLVTANLPDCTFMSDRVFAGCVKLKRVNLPNLTGLGYESGGTFANCYSLEQITMPRLGNIPQYAFNECSALKTVSFSGVTTISKRAFENCTSLRSAYFSIVETVGENVFFGCSSLQFVSMPKVKNIGRYAFDYCEALTNISFPAAVSIGSYAFANCGNIKSVYLPNVESVDDRPFFNCFNIENVYMPKLKVVVSNMFSDVSGISQVTFFGAESIEAGAFLNNANLRMVSFPNLAYLDHMAFDTCPKLESVYFMGSQIVQLSVHATFQRTPLWNSSYLGRYGSIFVPTSLLASYRAISEWEYLKDRLVGI